MSNKIRFCFLLIVLFSIYMIFSGFNIAAETPSLTDCQLKKSVLVEYLGLIEFADKLSILSISSTDLKNPFISSKEYWLDLEENRENGIDYKKTTFWAVIAFISGSVPYSKSMLWLFKKKDISKVGDGNPGAFNAFKGGGFFNRFALYYA